MSEEKKVGVTNKYDSLGKTAFDGKQSLQLARLSMLTLLLRSTIRKCKLTCNRTYSTSSQKELPFIYQYGSPLVKCTLIAAGTNLTLQAIYNTLEYADYRKVMDVKIERMEDQLKQIEEKLGN